MLFASFMALCLVVIFLQLLNYVFYVYDYCHNVILTLNVLPRCSAQLAFLQQRCLERVLGVDVMHPCPLRMLLRLTP
jgi:hypothetical protein